MILESKNLVCFKKSYVFLLLWISFFLLLLMNSKASSITIEEGLRIVTSRSREVRISRLEENMAADNISIARSYWLPRVDLYSYQTILRYEPEAKFGPVGAVPISERSFFTYGFNMKQLIYDFGKTGGLINSAHFKLKAKSFETKRVKNLIALEFIDAYFELLKAKSLLGVALKEVERFESHLRDTRAMYEEGLITKNDLLQAEVMLSDAEQKRIDAENLYKIRQSRLNMLLLEDLNKPIQAEDVIWHPFVEYTLGDAWQNALQYRPELKSIDAEISVAEAELNALKADYLPTLYASGGFEYQENRFMVHQGNWSLIGGINLNIFSGGLTRAEIRQKVSHLRAMELKKEKLKDSIKLEVKEAYLGLQSAKNRVEVTKKAVEQAEENLRLQRLRYKEGVGTATEVTDAVTLLTKAETNYLSALYDSYKAEARLIYTMGFDLQKAYNPSGSIVKEAENGKEQ